MASQDFEDSEIAALEYTSRFLKCEWVTNVPCRFNKEITGPIFRGGKLEISKAMYDDIINAEDFYL